MILMLFVLIWNEILLVFIGVLIGVVVYLLLVLIVVVVGEIFVY